MTEIKILCHLSTGSRDIVSIAEILHVPVKNAPVYMYRLRKKGWITSQRVGYQSTAVYGISQAGIEVILHLS